MNKNADPITVYSALDKIKTQTAVRHIEGFDFLRVTAVFGVVWIHGSDTNSVAKWLQGYFSFAVPCFLMMALFLTQKSLFNHPSLNYSQLLLHRLKRLFFPYFFWSLIYIFLRYIKRYIINHDIFDVNWISVLFFGGASYQLWFVPALLIWTALLAPVMFLSMKIHKAYSITFLLLMAVILFNSSLLLRTKIDVTKDFEMFRYMAGMGGYVLVGIALWHICSGLRLVKKSVWRNFLFFVTLTGVVLLLSGKENYTIFFLKFWLVPLYSVGIFILAITFTGRVFPSIMNELASCSYGIFLTHAIFVEGFQNLAVLTKIHINTFIATAGLIITSFTCSAALCIYLAQKKPTRWLVT